MHLSKLRASSKSNAVARHQQAGGAVQASSTHSELKQTAANMECVHAALALTPPC